MAHPRTPLAMRVTRQRQRIAAAAAALICEGSVADPLAARRKAAQRLGIHDERLMPERAEIEAALREHQRLFAGNTQPASLRRLREAAREAMQFLARFDPRLVGAVLDGTADRHSAVHLQLFSDDPETVIRHLQENGIDFDPGQRRIRMDRERAITVTTLALLADDIPFELTVLPPAALRQPPLDSHGEAPVARASLVQLEQLLAAMD